LLAQASVVGKYSFSIAAVCNHTPTTGLAPKADADPLKDKLTKPDVPTTGTHSVYQLKNSNMATISADRVYCGAISVSGAATLTLNAGTYVIKDGSFSVGNSGSVKANGPVTIFLTAPGGVAANVTLGGSR
jgi:hypothetical protein